MSYTQPVNLGDTEFPDELYTLDNFLEVCKANFLIDYDGYGYPVKDNKSDNEVVVKPSKLNVIPKDATHIVWFNR